MNAASNRGKLYDLEKHLSDYTWKKIIIIDNTWGWDKRPFETEWKYTRQTLSIQDEMQQNKNKKSIWPTENYFHVTADNR